LLYYHGLIHAKINNTYNYLLIQESYKFDKGIVKYSI